MLPENEYSEIESRYYLNPQVGLDESNKFIENLRSAQQQNTAQIAKDTAALGTDVSSNLGGLGGDTDYWTARLSTPQTTSAVANLRATAQAAALNQALQNEQEIWKNRYQQAYRNYQKRMNDKTNQPSTTGGSGPLDIDTNTGTEDKVEVSTYQPGAGQIIPNTQYVSDYQDASTGQWYQLSPIREIDDYAIKSSLASRNPSDGAVITINGKNFRYVAAKDEWYEQTSSAGPNTYSPRAW